MAPTGSTNLSPVVVSSQHAHGRCVIGQDRHLDDLEFVPLGRRKKALLREMWVWWEEHVGQTHQVQGLAQPCLVCAWRWENQGPLVTVFSSVKWG